MYVLQSSASACESNTADVLARVAVYRLYMSFVSSMLNTLKNGFVSDAISFIGVHQQRIHQVPVHSLVGLQFRCLFIVL